MKFIEHLSSAMGAIQILCGGEFLSKSAFPRDAQDHPLRTMFHEVDGLLNSRASLPRDLMAYPSIGRVMDLGTSLSWTTPLPGFDDQLKRRLLNNREYEAAVYELRIARRHAQVGQDVRFCEVPGQTEKGVDLLVFSEGREIHIEAKRKDGIDVAIDSNLPYQSLLNELIVETLGGFPYGVDVTALILGEPSEPSFRKAVAGVKIAIQNGERQSRFVPDPGFWLMVSDREPRLQSLEQLKSAIGSRPAKVRQYPTGPDSPPLYEASTFGLCAIPGQTVDSVMNSVSKASKKIAKGGSGIVYLHVNHGVQGIEVEWPRLLMMGSAIERRVWGGGLNTRIRALVMTGGPYIRPYMHDDFTYPGTAYNFAAFFHGDSSPDESGDARELLERVLRGDA